MDWHLKGAGLTPYSRWVMDGRFYVRRYEKVSPVRRALSGHSDDPRVKYRHQRFAMYRETVEPGAMLMRVAPSHLALVISNIFTIAASRKRFVSC